MENKMNKPVWMCKQLGVRFCLFANINSKWSPINKFIDDDTEYCLVLSKDTDQFSSSIFITAGFNTYQRGYEPEMISCKLHSGSILKLTVNKDILYDFTETSAFHQGDMGAFRKFLLKFFEVSYIEAFVNKQSVGYLKNKIIINN